LSHDDHARRCAHVRISKETAILNGPLSNVRILLTHSLDLGVPILAAENYLRARVDCRRNHRDAWHFAFDGVQVFNRQGVCACVTSAGADATDVLRSGTDKKQVGADASDLFLNRLLRSLANADHRDDCGNANDDAQHSQRRAHLVSYQRAKRYSNDH